MKLREKIEDFVVEEIPAAPPASKGDYLIARLEKRGPGTLEAVREVALRLGVSSRRISFGGLKDARAVTRQYLSIAPGDPPLEKIPSAIRGPLWNLDIVGRSARPYDRSSCAGNRFEVVVRDLARDEADAMRARADSLRRDGFCNYYDSQRFGSLDGAAGFVARFLIDGDYEGALRAAIASPRPGFAAEGDKIKAVMRDNWGRWADCKAALPRCRERNIAAYLCDHDRGFVHVFELLDRPLRLLYTGAYQSYLWNSALARIVARRVGENDVRFLNDVPGRPALYMALDDRAREFLHPLIIPQPTPKFFDEEMDDSARAAYGEVLEAEGLTPESFKLKKVRRTYFQKGRRPAVVVPGAFSVGPPEDDGAGRKKIMVKCELPRGAYVTMLVKSLGLR